MKIRFAAGLCLLALMLACGRVQQTAVVDEKHPPVTRAEVIRTAQAYADFTWRCGEDNANPQFNKLESGRLYQGVAYNWGGWDTLDQFQTKLTSGSVAGTLRREIHPNFAGVDCSGFVSRCWGIQGTRYSTRSLPNISDEIKWEELKPGDIFNKYDSHVRLFEHFDGRDPDRAWVFESTGDTAGNHGVAVDPGRVIRRSVSLSEMKEQGYLPRRYHHIVD